MSCESKSEVPSYFSQVKYFGGYGGGDPPLPIPNREVKPAIADGTAPPGGRVGSCRSSKRTFRERRPLFLFGSCLRQSITHPRPLLGRGVPFFDNPTDIRQPGFFVEERQRRFASIHRGTYPPNPLCRFALRASPLLFTGGRIPQTPCVASLRCFFDVLFFVPGLFESRHCRPGSPRHCRPRPAIFSPPAARDARSRRA